MRGGGHKKCGPGPLFFNPSLRLEFHKAWNASFKAQLLDRSHSYTAQYISSKPVFQTTSWALKPSFQALWFENTGLKLNFYSETLFYCLDILQ